MVKDTPEELLWNEPFPEVAAALRARSDLIISEWLVQVRRALSGTQDLNNDQLADHLPLILPGMADALEQGGRPSRLMDTSPAQGLTRFHQHYDVRALMTEDRLLRRIIIEQVELVLARCMSSAEHVALNMAVDLMLQQAVVAFVEQQSVQLRLAAEAELKYLSFLSHDLSNNLSSVTLMLQVLRQKLETTAEFAGDAALLADAQRSIADTVAGMGRLLQSERLRKAGVQPEPRPVDLRAAAAAVARQVEQAAARKAIRVDLDVPGGATADTDPELLGLVLQNLVGNAVKFAPGGSTVRIVAESGRDGACVMSVADEGPGIAPEHLGHIFDAFRRGAAHGQSGVGLGLTIASQAAKLLGAALDVRSTLGRGSTFALTLPAVRISPAAGA